jgi:hypothetical protein
VIKRNRNKERERWETQAAGARRSGEQSFRVCQTCFKFEAVTSARFSDYAQFFCTLCEIERQAAGRNSWERGAARLRPVGTTAKIQYGTGA